MPPGKRHPKKVITPHRPNLSSSTDAPQHSTGDDAKTTAKLSRASGPQQTRQPARRINTPHHQRRRRIEHAFHKQYYPHWILIGMVALLLAIGYQRSDEAYDFIGDLCKRTWRLISRTPVWSDGWSLSGDRGIERRSNLSLAEFRQVYDGQRPVLITDILQGWGAIHWTKDLFISQYGKHRVVMKAVDGMLDQAEGFSLPLETFIDHIDDSTPSRWTYVEDELFLQNVADLRKDIGSCLYLEEDFFKLFPEELRPWDAMFLWGTRYSRSSLHIDPYNWTGTNAVFRGMKQWKLYPPGQDHHLYVFPNRMSGFPLNSYKYNSPVDAFDPDLDKYPNFDKAKAIEFTQYPGELLIIPSGWFHQAYNAKETMAVSGQVMNTANYRMVLEEIIKADNLNMELLPVNIDEMTPAEQVRAAVESIPQSILDKGRRINENVRNQIKQQPHEHT